MAQSPENSPSDDSPPSSSSDDLSPPPKKKSDGGGDGDRSPPADEVSDRDSSPPPPPQQLPPSDKNSSADSDKSNAFPPPDFRNDNGDRDRNKSKPSRNSSRENGGGNKHDARTPSISADDSPPPNNSYSNDTAAIAGVLVGVGILIIVVVAITVCCVKRKKKKPQHMPSYNKYDTKANQGQYNPNWYSSGQPSNTGSSGAMPPQGGWQMPPPPPPHMMSSDMSGAYSSGPMGPPVPPPHPGLSLGGFTKSTFTYDELAAATQGFSQANLLGQGGFGFVHKGVLPNGKEVAVKSLKSGSGQGEREFQAEVEIISRVHHRHLVSLVGYCIAGGQRMLVYEFVPNGTLEFHLHGKGRPVMDFETRHKIALGSAKGLAYIHEDCNHRIIHRDIKTANILIDDAFEAKVADFGLAKLSSDTNQTHVSTRVMGTFGYLAPEYAASGKLTDKSDVFSYGVMLLELITGKRPIDPSGEEDSLVDWARPQLMRVLDEGRFEGLVDPRLENKFNTQEMTRMVACAAATIRHSAKRRPKMSQIVRSLEGDMSLEALNGEGVKPGQSTYFGAGGTGSGEYDANSYKQDMKKFMMTLNEDDYTSSEYGSSNEYGRHGSGFTSTGGRSGTHGTKN